MAKDSWDEESQDATIAKLDAWEAAQRTNKDWVRQHKAISILADIIIANDGFKMVIWGYVLLKDLLDLAIPFVLVAPDEIDVRAMRFETKIDLAIGLRLIPLELREYLRTLARLRHQLVHVPGSEFGSKEAGELARTLATWDVHVEKPLGNHPEGVVGRSLAMVMGQFLKGISTEMQARKTNDEITKLVASLPEGLAQRMLTEALAKHRDSPSEASAD